jgi:Flp pilus assembly protein protease CpaA
MNYETIRLAIVLTGTAIAAFQDFKTSYIDDKLTLTMITVGVALDLLTLDYNFILYSVGIGALIFIIGYYFYKTGQIGGGDVLLVAGIQVLLPFYPSTRQFQFPFSLAVTSVPFIMTIFATSALISLIGTALTYGWALKDKKLKPELKDSLLTITLIALIIFSIYLFSNFGSYQIIFLLILAIPSIFLSMFKNQIMNEIIIQKVSLNEVEDEDVLALEKMPNLKKYGLKRVATKDQMKILKKISREKKSQKFYVYKNLPRMAPYILIGLILSLILGNPFAWVLLK